MIGRHSEVLLALLFLACSSLADEGCPGDRSPGDVTPGPVSGMEFAYIPSGSFQMGHSEIDPEFCEAALALHVHTVTIDHSFEMMTTEVTQAMWKEVMGTTIQHQHGLAEFDYGLPGTGDDYPMYYVTWEDCQDFVEAMNVLDPTHEYRLPSEAEWEYC